MSTLFSLVKVGPYQLSTVFVMGRLTRMRTVQATFRATERSNTYSQRESKCGLIIAEATRSIRATAMPAGPESIPTRSDRTGW